MTRWARAEGINKKKPHQATDWGNMFNESNNDALKSEINKSTISKNDETGHTVKKKLKRDKKRKPDDKITHVSEGKHVVNKVDSDGSPNKKQKISEESSTKSRKKKKKIISCEDDEKKQAEISDNDSKIFKTVCTTSKQITEYSNMPTKKRVIDFQNKHREDRRLKRKEERESKRVCFNCRSPGHTLANCPQVNADTDQGTGICFKCGSTEHTSSACQVRLPKGEYPFAKCFVCSKMGHLSKKCPDNPRGLYPNGGCCKGCGSIYHFKAECPVLLKKQGIVETTVQKMSAFSNPDIEPDVIPDAAKSKRKSASKIVTF